MKIKRKYKHKINKNVKEDCVVYTHVAMYSNNVDILQPKKGGKIIGIVHAK